MSDMTDPIERRAATMFACDTSTPDTIPADDPPTDTMAELCSAYSELEDGVHQRVLETFTRLMFEAVKGNARNTLGRAWTLLYGLVREVRRRGVVSPPRAPVPETSTWRHDWLPKRLPRDWRVAAVNDHGASYANRDGLLVIASSRVEADGKRWAHVSYSRAGQRKTPTWADTVAVRNLMFGSEAMALSLVPATSQNYSLHPGVLHLWSCLDGDPLPDFTAGIGGV